MAFPIAGEWNLYANGFNLSLSIGPSADQATVTGKISEGGQPSTIQEGKWNDALRQITFERVIDTGEVQTYTGFLFDLQVPIFPVFLGGTSVMAGTFTSTGGYENPDKAMVGWGWFAYFVGPVKPKRTGFYRLSGSRP